MATAPTIEQSDTIGILRDALQSIACPLAYLARRAEAEGNRLSGMAYAIANDPEFLKSLAREGLRAASPCTQCGEASVTELDGDYLCQAHADQWVRGESAAAAERLSA